MSTLTIDDPEEFNRIYREILSHYYVRCAITGNPLRCDILSYWDVTTQECYSDPYLIAEHKAKQQVEA